MRAMEPDRGLDSPADLKMLERLLFYGLVAVVIVGVLAVLITGQWLVLLGVLASYAAVAAIQWVAVNRRMSGERDPR